MNQIVWLSAGTWQHTQPVSVERLTKAVPRASPLYAGLGFLLWVLGEDAELSDRDCQPAEPRCHCRTRDLALSVGRAGVSRCCEGGTSTAVPGGPSAVAFDIGRHLKKFI